MKDFDVEVGLDYAMLEKFKDTFFSYGYSTVHYSREIKLTTEKRSFHSRERSSNRMNLKIPNLRSSGDGIHFENT